MAKKTHKCCGSCKWLYKLITDEPCMLCEHYEKWEINDNLKKKPRKRGK